MKKVSKQQALLADLETWAMHVSSIDKAYEALKLSVGADSDSPFWSSIWKMQGEYGRQVCLRHGVKYEHLEWYQFENEMGSNALPAFLRVGGKCKPIAKLEDLVWLMTGKPA